MCREALGRPILVIEEFRMVDVPTFCKFSGTPGNCTEFFHRGLVLAAREALGLLGVGGWR